MSITNYNHRLYNVTALGDLPGSIAVVKEFKESNLEGRLKFEIAISYALRSLNFELVMYIMEQCLDEVDLNYELYEMLSNIEFANVVAENNQKSNHEIAVDEGNFCYETMKTLEYKIDYESAILAGRYLDIPLVKRLIDDAVDVDYVDIAETLVHDDAMIHFKRIISRGRRFDVDFDYNVLIGYAASNSTDSLETVIMVAKDETTDVFDSIDFAGAVVECISRCDFDNMKTSLVLLLKHVKDLNVGNVLNEIQIAIDEDNLNEIQAEEIRKLISK